VGSTQRGEGGDGGLKNEIVRTSMNSQRTHKRSSFAISLVCVGVTKLIVCGKAPSQKKRNLNMLASAVRNPRRKKKKENGLMSVKRHSRCLLCPTAILRSLSFVPIHRARWPRMSHGESVVLTALRSVAIWVLGGVRRHLKLTERYSRRCVRLLGHLKLTKRYSRRCVRVVVLFSGVAPRK
jgi:hypothetical protein